MKSVEMNNDGEPPSCEPPSCEPSSCEPSSCMQPIFTVGQDSRGNWVVREKFGTRGGLFVDRAEALRYIRSESGASIMAAECFELEISAAVAAVPKSELQTPGERRVA